MNDKELSPLARQLLGQSGHVQMFTQTEFDESLALAKAEIMMVAIETTKKAIAIEREECAQVAERLSHSTGDFIASAIRNRLVKVKQL